MSAIPQILRIKRKRGQDPLQALVLEGESLAKRSKPSSPIPSATSSVTNLRSYFFELASTDTREPAIRSSNSGLTLSETTTGLRKRRFVIPKQESDDEEEIPSQLHQMLDEFLTLEEELPEKLKKRRGSTMKSAEDKEHEVESNPADEYVFDVYKLSANEQPLTSMNYPQSQIGYIRFFDDEESALVNVDESRDPRDHALSEDEDSNAESFYQNDYPEDEDAGEFSETYENINESDEDSDYYYDDDRPVIASTAEQMEGQSYLRGDEPSNAVVNGEFDNLYDDFFDEEGNRKTSLLEACETYENYDADADAY